VLKVALGPKRECRDLRTDYERPMAHYSDYIHIVDLARAHILALGASGSGFYNLGREAAPVFRRLLRPVANYRRKIGTVEKPRRPGDRRGLSLPRKKSKKSLVATPVPVTGCIIRARGRGIRSSTWLRRVKLNAAAPAADVRLITCHRANGSFCDRCDFKLLTSRLAREELVRFCFWVPIDWISRAKKQNAICAAAAAT